MIRLKKILHGDISPWNLMIEKLSRRVLLIDYDYAIDLDERRQTSKPYPSTPDVWPSKQNEEELPTDDDAQHEANQTLSADDVKLQKRIVEEFKKKLEKKVELFGQHTVCLFVILKTF